eukprot:NODE_766_length_1193_cov_368.849650_g578_i1.p1 GENE.NODE_766_length_1193_cov_368.849650_g578_i1~~NODE_766_length_1193_cov_368.849650_g578_i1.p1  ORF type:complete len:274 (-),score=29.76 NODE_766_length_1193_cov_368.849650_g578_i1:300-1121(-)
MTELRPRQPQGTSRMLQAAKPRVDNRGTKSSTLDFSFCDLNTVSDMYRVAPHSGQVKDLPQNQNAAPAEAEEERQQGAADDFADHDTRASHGSDKAKKKQRGRLTMFGNEEDEEADEEQQAQRTLQYHATSLKLDNNHIKSLDGLLTVLSHVVVNATSMLSWLDLSFNQIVVLPADLETLPLQVLNLHVNQIADIEQVGKLSKIKTLRKLTLHGNPIESTVRNYRYAVYHLIPHIISLDFSVFTPQDKTTVETYRKLYVAPAEKKLQQSGRNY